MSDEGRDPILAAVAITRAQLMKITGEKTTKATLEATALEVSTAADPLEVVNALGLVSAHAVVLAAATMAALGDASGPAALPKRAIEKESHEHVREAR